MADVTFLDVRRLQAEADTADVALAMDEDAFRAFYDRTAGALWGGLSTREVGMGLRWERRATVVRGGADCADAREAATRGIGAGPPAAETQRSPTFRAIPNKTEFPMKKLSPAIALVFADQRQAARPRLEGRGQRRDDVSAVLR